MKHLLLTTIAAVVLVGCGESQQSAPTSAEVKPAEPVAEVAQPEPPAAKALDISIHSAALDGNIEAIKQYIAAGTDVNAKDDNGFLPLHLAADRGHTEVVELLITKGAEVNAQSDGGNTPLDWAVDSAHSDEKTANLLRKHGGKTRT